MDSESNPTQSTQPSSPKDKDAVPTHARASLPEHRHMSAHRYRPRVARPARQHPCQIH